MKAHAAAHTKSIVPVSTGACGIQSVEIEGLQVSSIRFPPRRRLGRHEHERACLSVLLDGRFDEVVSGRTLSCQHGSVLTKPAGEPHSDCFGVEGSCQIVIEPQPGRVDALEPVAQLFGEVACFRHPGAAHFAARIAHELHARDAWAPMAIEGLVLELLAATARHVAVTDEARVPAWAKRVRDLLHEEEPYAVTDLAQAAGVHPVYLARVFRRHFGTSIGDYRRRVRLERAAVDLIGSTESIAAIAARLGFFDQSHFTRCFKRTMGLTPAQYRHAFARPC